MSELVSRIRVRPVKSADEARIDVTDMRTSLQKKELFQKTGRLALLSNAIRNKKMLQKEETVGDNRADSENSLESYIEVDKTTNPIF